MNKTYVLILLIFITLFYSCEKHDGEYYAKQKCEITIDGKTYIDQPHLSLVASSPIPGFQIRSYWYEDENGATVEWPNDYVQFITSCAPKRGEEWEIGIEVAIFNSDLMAIVGEPIQFRLDSSQDDSNYQTYREYCIFNGINYAVISFRKNDIATFVDSGTLTISSMTNDMNPYSCNGTFEFNLEIDGKQHTIKGEFESVPYYY